MSLQSPNPRRIVVLTGSGISAESGVATFRDANGIWAKYDHREVASPEAFATHPKRVHGFYNDRRRQLASVEPNAAHFALARLERRLEKQGGRLTLVTQNVDDLHERAGSQNVLHIHGELLKATCRHCDALFPCDSDLTVDLGCPSCRQSGGLRPYVVWFGEVPRFLDEASEALLAADEFVSIGTSGSVYPAAGFVSQALAAGVTTTELNLEPSENAHLFNTRRYGPATQVVPEWASELQGSDRVE